MMIRSRIFWLCLACTFASATPAQDDLPLNRNLRVSPDRAPAGTMVYALYDAWCPTSVSDETVVRQGNVVTLTHRVDFFCMMIPHVTMQVPLGRFGPGNYTLVYAPVHMDGTPYARQSVDFTVLPGPNAVPSTSWQLRLLLVLALVVVASLCIGTSKSRPG